MLAEYLMEHPWIMDTGIVAACWALIGFACWTFRDRNHV